MWITNWVKNPQRSRKESQTIVRVETSKTNPKEYRLRQGFIRLVWKRGFGKRTDEDLEYLQVYLTRYEAQKLQAMLDDALRTVV